MGILLLAALLCLLSFSCDGKHVAGSGYFGLEKITEVTKFSFRPGTSTITGNVTYMGHARGSVYLFMDTNWSEKFHAEVECDKIQHAHSRLKIGQVGGSIGTGIGVGEGFEPTFDELKHKYTWSFRWTVTHAVRTYGWYVVIADCPGFKNGDPATNSEDAAAAGKKKRRLRRNRVEYVMDLLNPGGDHLPADEHGLPTLYWIVTFAMGGYFFYSSNNYKKRTGNGLIFDSHAIIKAFAFAYIFQVFSMTLEILHLWRYSYNGSGYAVMDFFSEFFEGISQLIISFSLLCLGNGWTLVEFSNTSRKPSMLKQLLNKPTLDDETPTLFILIVLVFVSTILQVINKVQDDDFLKFHDHDGIAGKFLLFQRTVLGIMFFTSARGTINSDEVQGKVQMEGFLRRLWFFGSIWFFAFPVLVILASIFAHYLRHRIVTGGVLLIQSLCLTLLSQQLFSSSSWYSKVSSVGSTGLLPGFMGGKGGKLY